MLEARCPRMVAHWLHVIGGLRSADMRFPPEARARRGRVRSPPGEDNIRHKNCVIDVGLHSNSRSKDSYRPNLLPHLLFFPYTK